MVRLMKLLLGLAVLAGLGLTAYAYLGDIAPQIQEVRQPVTIDAD